jgi:hypothetical protein
MDNRFDGASTGGCSGRGARSTGPDAGPAGSGSGPASSTTGPQPAGRGARAGSCRAGLPVRRAGAWRRAIRARSRRRSRSRCCLPLGPSGDGRRTVPTWARARVRSWCRRARNGNGNGTRSWGWSRFRELPGGPLPVAGGRCPSARHGTRPGSGRTRWRRGTRPRTRARTRRRLWTGRRPRRGVVANAGHDARDAGAGIWRAVGVSPPVFRNIHLPAEAREPVG